MERTLVKVEVGPCRCMPDFPHGTDWVELTPNLSVPLGAAVYAAIRSAGSDDVRLQGLMAQAYLLFGIKRWSFTDDAGDPVRVEHSATDWADTVDQWLPWGMGGKEVAEKADSLYSDEVLRPFLSRPSTQSPDGQMDGSTSPIRPTGPKPLTQSKRSSPPDMDGTQSSG